MNTMLKIIFAIMLLGFLVFSSAIAWFVYVGDLSVTRDAVITEFKTEIGADENFDFSNLNCEVTVNNNDNSLFIDCVDPTKAKDNDRPQTPSQTDPS